MTLTRAWIALIWLLFATRPLFAHEFWLSPVATPHKVGGTASLTLQVGEFFEGELVGFSLAQTTTLRQYSAAGSKDLRPGLPADTALPALLLPLATGGTQLVAFENQPSRITLSADRFHAYLHDEGLDAIKARREAAGVAEQPARERYRRYVKTLFRVAPAGGAGKASARPTVDVTYATRTGQRLEIMPLADPLLLTPGAALGVRVLFEDKPLAGALLKAWHKRTGQTLVIRALSSANGTASFDLPYAGPWMISVVHMIPATGEKDVDWDSLWGNLTFVMPPARAAR